MNVNSNRANQPASKPRHISRLRKEMLEHRMQHHPFSSPPSSTGSHDTVSTTTEELSHNLSNFSFSPDAEGTPSKRHTSRSGRFSSRQNQNTMLNTSAIARTFPEWSGLVAKDTATFSQTVDMAVPIKPISSVYGGKENVPPTAERAHDDAQDSKRRRSLADMQARVENESDCSTVLSLSPAAAPGTRRSRFGPAQPDGIMSPETTKRSLHEMVSKIRTEKQTSKHGTTPRRSPPSEAVQHSHETPAPGHTITNLGYSPTGHSFFLPAFRHLPDWTSGTLKFSTMKNGVPVFVRSGKPGVRLEHSAKNHGSMNAVGMPEEDEEIFVSLDKLQEEVRELHDHDAMLQREAERLQLEVNQLQSELKRFKSRKSTDSAIGSDTDGSFRRSGGYNHDAEDQIAQLHDRLEQASRQVGVHDIHNAALAAERDEALHQASVARERAMRLQAELEATQKDLEASLQFLQEKETLQLEHASLLAENETLREQRDVAVGNNKTLTAQNEKLRRELSGVQKDLSTTREQLASVRKQYEALQEEKRLVSQDHASMERNNETYFKENKKLKAQVAARDQHIADLKKGISTRDKMIDNIQGLPGDTAILELNAELEAELERLHTRVEQQTVELHQKDGDISAKEGRIRSLKEQNLDLQIDNERLREENQRLRTEHEEIRGQWIDERHKVVRLNQLLSKNNGDYLKTLHDNTGDCVRVDDSKQKEEALRLKLERREAAVKKVKLLSSKISEIAQQEFTGIAAATGKTTKVTRIIEPKDMLTATEELTGKSSAPLNVDNDPTAEINFTRGSDFASIMEGEIAKLRQTYQDLQQQQQQQQQAAGNTMQLTDYSLPPLPPPTLQRSKSDSGVLPSRAAQSKAHPPGILKKSSQFALEEDTGRFSVKSALSILSHHTEESFQLCNATATQNDTPCPNPRSRRNSEGARDPTMAEPNMTSAFFMPDITLQGNKQGTGARQPTPALSKDARRVLDGICKHNSVNCNVCVRIAAHGDKTMAGPVSNSGNNDANTTNNNTIPITAEDVRKGKKTVCVEKPVPVSDRAVPEPERRESEEPTMRPSMAPGEALAILIKETQDEIDHLQMELKRMNEVYFSLDKALGQRERRRVMGEIKKLQADVEAKSGHLYKLHDVLEGQKQAGQLMAREEVDVTVLDGLLRATEVRAESRQNEKEWNGFD
ncbi:Protein Daple [Madurella mycetomatis]|uniref:Protein Daple n=1 Tax=Madurella mycetomatis TaxID=100816 RepID=A0A175WF40_9PEZI|nr:Protein Daple [Madurella mycetomatis]